MERVTIETIKKLHVEQVNAPRLLQYRYLELTWNHSLIVGKIALQLATNYQEKTNIKPDRELIKLGALVYRIGVYYSVIRRQDDSDAEFLGSKILAREEFPLELVVFPLSISSPNYREHVLQELQIPMDKYSVPTLEEMLIGYADHFHDGRIGNPRFIEHKEAWKKMKRSGKKSRGRFEILEDEFGEPDLSVLKEKYNGWHEEMRNYYAGLVLPNP